MLSRFRQEKVAFISDIESMFLQVRVPEQDRSFFRFLWWRDGDPGNEILEYQMTVHLFGPVSSPSVANYVVKLIGKAASDPAAAETLQRNFYVDDCLRFIPTVDPAIQLIDSLRETCKRGGFNLNATNVIRSISTEHHYSDLHGKAIDYDPFHVIRALGIHWWAADSTDQFEFAVTLRDRPEN